MAYREFTDADGTVWTAWDVPPWRVFSPARNYQERRVRETPGYTPERRAAVDRRRSREGAMSEQGWVCFERPGEKRRLAPTPAGWDEVSEDELLNLCRRASPDTQRR